MIDMLVLDVSDMAKNLTDLNNQKVAYFIPNAPFTAHPLTPNIMAHSMWAFSMLCYYLKPMAFCTSKSLALATSLAYFSPSSSNSKTCSSEIDANLS